MDHALSQFITDPIGRIDGPMRARLYIQLLIPISSAFRDGRLPTIPGGRHSDACGTDPVRAAAGPFNRLTPKNK